MSGEEMAKLADSFHAFNLEKCGIHLTNDPFSKGKLEGDISRKGLKKIRNAITNEKYGRTAIKQSTFRYF